MTEKNEEILMVAKQASLKRRYFDLMLHKAEQMQIMRSLQSNTVKEHNSKLRRKAFDVLLTNLIVKRMHESQKQRQAKSVLQLAFNGLKTNS